MLYEAKWIHSHSPERKEEGGISIMIQDTITIVDALAVHPKTLLKVEAVSELQPGRSVVLLQFDLVSVLAYNVTQRLLL
jgi:hypothetical protein